MIILDIILTGLDLAFAVSTAVFLLAILYIAMGATMTQADLFLENQLFPSFRADLNNNLLALASLSSGTGEPPNPVAYMFWADSGTGSLKLRNAANSDWLTVGNLTQQNLGLSTATTGHVLQFQYASTSAQVQLNDNNSWQNAGPSITITPQQANSVLLLYLVVGGVKTDGSLVTLRVIQQGAALPGLMQL